MEIGGKAVDIKKNKGAKWDGKSRVSNDLYRKNFDQIFKKVTDNNAEEIVHGDPFKKEQAELNESYQQSKKNKKDREKTLRELDERNGF